MTTTYPAKIDTAITLPLAVDNLTPVQASIFNNQRNAVLAIETALGVQPEGIYGTVTGRFATLENIVGNLQIIRLAKDLGGTLSNPLVIGLQGNPVSNSLPGVGEVLTWDGIAWVPATVSGGGGGSGNIAAPTISIQSNNVSGSTSAGPVTIQGGNALGTGQGGTLHLEGGNGGATNGPSIVINGSQNPTAGNIQVISNATSTGGALVVDGSGNVSSTGFFPGSSVYAPGIAPPNPNTLTWINQAGGISGNATFVIDPGGGPFTLISPPVGDNAEMIHVLVTSAPSEPWTFTIGCIIDGTAQANNFRAGLVLRESSTGKILHLCMTDQSSGSSVESWTNATTKVSEDYLASALGGAAIRTAYANSINYMSFLNTVYFRVQDDGTNLFFSFSTTGSLFTPYAVSSSDGVTPLPVAKNNFFTVGPDQIGVAINNVDETARSIALRVFSWQTTSP